MDDGHTLSEVGTLVLTGEWVDGVGPKGDLRGGPGHSLGDLGCDGGIEPTLDVEHGYSGILAHRDSHVLCLLHVVHYGSELCTGDLLCFPSCRSLEGPAYVHGDLGVGETEEVDNHVLHRFRQLYHVPMQAIR